MAKENKDLMVFENVDGSGKILLSKDPKTGKYSIVTIGDIDVDEDGSVKGTVRVRGDVTTDINIDGDVELYGHITGKVVASGDIHCNKTAELSSTAKISPYTQLDSYDISVSNGNCEFTGDISGFNDGKTKTLVTNHTIKTKNLSDIWVHTNLSIITSDEFGILHNGESFCVCGNSKLCVYSSHENGCGIKIDCSNLDHTVNFWVDTSGTLESFGKKFGIVVMGGPNNYDTNTFSVHNCATANIYGDCGISNSGRIFAHGDSNINVFGSCYGIKNCGPYGNFILESGCNVSCVGGACGFVQDVYTLSNPDKYGNRYNASFVSEKDSKIKIIGGIGYMLGDDTVVDILDSVVCNSTSAIEDAFISVEGDVYVTSAMKDSDYSKLPIKCYRGGGRVYLNSAVVWEGQDSEKYKKSKERWG